MISSRFSELYAKLNPKQKEAVDAIDGPVIVFAGPGTGKTQILTLRIVNILMKTDTAPDSILALTFTEAAAANMRRRLFEIIGAPAYRVRTATFHGFCNDLIQSVPEAFPRIIGSQHVTDTDRFELVKEIVLQIPLELLRPHGDELYYIHSILRAISDLKREGVYVNIFEERILEEEKRFSSIEDLYHTKGTHEGKMKSQYKTLEKSIAKNKELLRVYGEYERALRDRKWYDYDDMIMEVVRTLHDNQDLLFSLQEKYQYVLADEHQDVNNAQNTLLELLSNYDSSPNIFIVGDDKQAIFRFQGASLQNFFYFLKRYPRAKAITLEENYRSTQRILDAAHGLISNAGSEHAQLHRELTAKGGQGDEKILIRVFEGKEDEFYALAENIRGRINSGVLPEEIAVLYRDNKDAIRVSDSFEKMHVPFFIYSDQNIFHDPDIKNLILLFKSIHHFGEDEWIIKAFHLPYLSIHPFDVYRVLGRAHETRRSFFTVLHSLMRGESLELESKDSLLHAYEMLLRWQKESHEKGANEMFEIVVRESGFLGYVLNRPDAAKKLGKITTLFREIERQAENHSGYTVSDLVGYFDLIAQHNIVLKGIGEGARPLGVQCMTAHKAKGLEFDYVYIVDVVDGHWGNRRATEHFRLPIYNNSFGDFDDVTRKNDDERRLFYVALTRARKEVCVSYAKRDEAGREMLPSQFISEIPTSHKEENLLPSFTTEEKATFVFAPRKLTPESIYDKDFVRHLFEARGISATGLNHYLECPWKYFYLDLLRIPQAKNRASMYGIAVHEALHALFDRLRTGETVTQEDFLVLFKRSLEKQPFSSRMSNDVWEMGRKSLGGYYEYYSSMWHLNTLNEVRIEGVELIMASELPPIRLVGRVDKIEMLGSHNDVNVVDYKTSKPKSRNEIEGLTKGSEGGYKRQLTFYKYLFDNCVSPKYHMVSGEIDFVEPNDRGIYKKEKFIITPEETAFLHGQLMAMAKEVYDVAFWDRRCDEKECEYCELRNNIN